MAHDVDIFCRFRIFQSRKSVGHQFLGIAIAVTRIHDRRNDRPAVSRCRNDQARTAGIGRTGLDAVGAGKAAGQKLVGRRAVLESAVHIGHVEFASADHILKFRDLHAIGSDNSHVVSRRVLVKIGEDGGGGGGREREY